MPLMPVQGGAPLGQLGNGLWYPTDIRTIRIIKVATDEDVPLIVREAFVGLMIRSCFAVKQISDQLEEEHPGARLVYARDAAHSLRMMGKHEALGALLSMEKLNELTMLFFKKEDYEFIA